MSSVSQQKSDEYRKAGNNLFCDGKYLESIVEYNKALVWAQNDDEKAALCYGNRSAAYLKMKYYKHCLHNIDLAEPHFPADGLKKLQDRREKCLEDMMNFADESLDAFEHEFKLSYDANPKLPFFIDALKLEDDPHDGKHLITTVPSLKAGDVIAVIDKPWRLPVSSLRIDHILGCYTCFDIKNGDLMPGMCCQAMFCSEKCKGEHHRKHSIHHDSMAVMENSRNSFSSASTYFPIIFAAEFFTRMLEIFGSVTAMRNFIDQHSNENYDLFDFDWSVEDDVTLHKNTFLAIIHRYSSEKLEGLNAETLSKLLPEEFELRKILIDPNHAEFIMNLWKKLSRQAHHYLTTEIDPQKGSEMIASLTHPALDLVRDGCDPNTHIHSNRKAIVFTVLRPIEAGEAICWSSAPYFLRKFVPSQNIICRNNRPDMCLPCKDQWAKQLIIGPPEIDCSLSLMHLINDIDNRKLSTYLEVLKPCNDIINANADGYYTDIEKRRLIALKMSKIRFIMTKISEPFRANNFTYVNNGSERNKNEGKKMNLDEIFSSGRAPEGYNMTTFEFLNL